MPGKLSSQLRRQAKEFDDLAKRTRKETTVEQIHDLRVLTRRIRASVWMGRRMKPSGALNTLRRMLRKLGRALGERRMLDVAGEDARAYGLDPAPIQARREAAAGEVHRLLKAGRRRDFVKGMNKAARGLARARLAALSDPLRELQARLLEALRDAGQGKVQLHRLRIEAKKVRYVFEFLGRDVARLKELQEHLGRGHDLEVLQELLGTNKMVAADEARAWEDGKAIMSDIVAQTVKEIDEAAEGLARVSVAPRAPGVPA